MSFSDGFFVGGNARARRLHWTECSSVHWGTIFAVQKWMCLISSTLLWGALLFSFYHSRILLLLLRIHLSATQSARQEKQTKSAATQRSPPFAGRTQPQGDGMYISGVVVWVSELLVERVILRAREDYWEKLTGKERACAVFALTHGNLGIIMYLSRTFELSDMPWCRT